MSQLRAVGPGGAGQKKADPLPPQRASAWHLQVIQNVAHLIGQRFSSFLLFHSALLPCVTGLVAACFIVLDVRPGILDMELCRRSTGDDNNHSRLCRISTSEIGPELIRYLVDSNAMSVVCPCICLGSVVLVDPRRYLVPETALRIDVFMTVYALLQRNMDCS